MSKKILCVLLFVLSLPVRGSELIPSPPELQRDVDFWVKVYTKIDTNSGYLHDAANLSVIYEELHFPPGSTYAQREKIVKKAKRRYEKALKDIAFNPAAPMNFSLRKVKNAWPKGTSARTFRSASDTVRFQLGQSDRFREGLVRSGLWRDHIRQVLKAEGLPPEIEVLPHVESSFNPAAYSKAAAAGLWQFMPGTAREFMSVDHIVDERMDPYISTVAAVQLLKRNHRITGSWPLALTGYNHGAYGIKRAADTMGTTDITTLVRRYKGPAFGFASRNFYVSFLAALEVDRNYQHYFGNLTLDKPVNYDVVVLGDYLPASVVARALGTNITTLRQHNPALLNTVWSGEKYIPKGFELRYPKNHLQGSLASAIGTIPRGQRFAYQQPDMMHRIAPGESLSVIARRYNTSVRELMALNGLRDSHSIRAGKELKLPGRVAPAGSGVAVASATTTTNKGVSNYVVQKGDSIWKITRTFNITEKELFAANNNLDAKTLRPGQVVRLPVKTVAVRAIPSTYVIQPGDSLWSIARRFNLSVKQLTGWNNLGNAHTIIPGETLKIALGQ